MVWHCWSLTSTEHLVLDSSIGKQSGIGIGIGNGMNVGRIHVKFDKVPFVNVVNKFDDVISDDLVGIVDDSDDDDDEGGTGTGIGGGARIGGTGGGGGAWVRAVVDVKNGYWKRLTSTGGGQFMLDGRMSEGCQERLTGRLEGTTGACSIRWIFTFNGEADDEDDEEDLCRFDGGDDENFRAISFVLTFDVGRWNGTKSFLRFVSFNDGSVLLVPFFFSRD